MKSSALATFASGCFWCTEAVFKRLRGVLKVGSGYTGGTTEHPNYAALHQSRTGHAEAVQVEFDPSVIPYERLLDVFFATHDPTTLNRQGNDIGEEYRSVIFYHSEEQKAAAEGMIQKLEQEKVFANPIVTSIEPAQKFYPAEAEHQDFYDRNPNKPYCQIVIDPKIAKLRQKFAEYLKD
ncbi:MAG: peptide-methionine (S)-S-oxide reductase MsrA [Candidatus Nomurabacteria bacterium]|nr:MAG: peptide-methionine (S)-S-oxide reductase MsrA [Candidatus Nomurabacteria bacterium]